MPKNLFAIFMAIFITSHLLPSKQAIANTAVLELFTSEGCSSCPPADKILADLTDWANTNGIDLITLGYHVDYWNYLGWEDRFSKKKFTQRQYLYSKQANKSTVYTPQLILNGHKIFEGYRENLAKQYIKDTLSHDEGRSLSLKQNGTTLHYQTEGIYPPHSQINIAYIQNHNSSDVTRGENRGRTLHHVNIVVDLDAFPLKNEGDIALNIPPEATEVVAFIQDEGSLKILSAQKLKIR